MKPTDNIYGNWPSSGEIDIVEMKGNANFSCDGNPIGRQLAGSTLHWGPDPSQDRWRLSHWEKCGSIQIDANLYVFTALSYI